MVSEQSYKFNYSMGVGLLYWSSAMYLIGKWSTFKIDIFSYMSLNDILNCGASRALETSIFYFIIYLINYNHNLDKISKNSPIISEDKKECILEKLLSVFKNKVIILSLYASFLFSLNEYLWNKKIADSSIYFLDVLMLIPLPFLLIRLYPNISKVDFFQNPKLNSINLFAFTLYSLILLGVGAYESEKIIVGTSENLSYSGSNIELRDAKLIGHVGNNDFYYSNGNVFVIQNQEISKFEISKIH